MKRRIVLILACLVCSCWLKAQLWTSVQGGCSGDVRDFLPDTNANVLYVVGSFHSAGGTEVWGTATWDGMNWEPIGGGTGDTLNEFWSPPILSVAQFEGNLFVGGMMIMEGDPSIRFLSRWDGTKWNACGSPTTPAILEVTNGRFFAMGGFDSIGGKPIRYLASWDGNEWVSFGSPLIFPNGGDISCSGFYQGEYYFGGNFDHPDGYREILRWDGNQWKALGAGVAGAGWVNDITVYKGQLFVGGEFHAGDGNASSYVMAWDGSQWYDPFPEVQYTTQVKALEVIDGRLYIVGNHAVWDGSGWHGLYNLARYDGQDFCSFGGEYLWTTGITGFQGDLYVSTGRILNPFGADSLFPNGRDTVNYIARWLGGDSVDYCVSQPVRVEEMVEQSQIVSIYPNPAEGYFHVKLPENSTGFSLHVLDMSGRVLAAWERYSGGEVDVSGLPPGVYFVEVRLRDGVEVVKLVKQ